MTPTLNGTVGLPLPGACTDLMTRPSSVFNKIASLSSFPATEFFSEWVINRLFSLSLFSMIGCWCSSKQSFSSCSNLLSSTEWLLVHIFWCWGWWWFVRLLSREWEGDISWAGECLAEVVLLGVGDVVQDVFVAVDEAELFVRVWLRGDDLAWSAGFI